MAEVPLILTGARIAINLLPYIRGLSRDKQLTKSAAYSQQAADEAWSDRPKWTERQKNDMVQRLKQ
jgi:hypothetical protein